MNIILALVIGAVGGYWFGAYRSGSDLAKTSEVEYASAEEARKHENIQKILNFIADKDRITNDDVEQLLGVSNTTVGRYLSELEAKGVIAQHGTIGAGVFYTKTPE